MPDTISGAERLATSLAFEKPDRVPVVPLFVKATAANYCGVSQAVADRDPEVALQCMLKTFDDVGGWDALYSDCPDTAMMQVLFWQVPLRWRVPGVDLPEDALPQVVETEVMTVADYDRIIEAGWSDFY